MLQVWNTDFSLCETRGYLWNSFVYLGKEANVSPEEAAFQKELGKSGAVLPKLMSDLYGKGHHLYVNNWYTSEKLFRHLEQNGTAACGTAMGYHLKVPKSLKTEPLEKGEHAFQRNENLLQRQKRNLLSINHPWSQDRKGALKRKRWNCPIKAIISQRLQQEYGWSGP